MLPQIEVREIHLFFFKSSSVMASGDFELEHQKHCVCVWGGGGGGGSSESASLARGDVG